LTVQEWTSVAMFGFSILGAVLSYFKTTTDMRHDLERSIYRATEKIRDEMRLQYATKEETKFQHESLVEIKTALKEINLKLENFRN